MAIKKKKIARILLWSIGVLFLLMIISVFLVYTNREKIKSVLIEELNKQLTTEIKVSSIGIEFFSTFPSASLRLNNVVAFDAFPNSKENKDTLFSFERIYLTFSIWDIVKEKYNIKKIIAENGSFNMKVLSDGDCNYIFWRKSEKKSENNFALSLRKIELKNINYTYRNDCIKQYYEILLNKASAKGNFTDIQQDIVIRSKSILRRFQIDNLIFASNRNFDFYIDISNNTNTKMIKVKKGDLNFDKLKFNLLGHLVYGEGSNIDINVKSNRVRIEEMIQLLPQRYSNLFEGYNSKGEIIFNLKMNGDINNKTMPNLIAYFNINNAELYNKKLGVSFTNINLKGRFSNGEKRKTESSYIELNNFCFNCNKGTVKGYAKLSNLSKLNLNTNLDCNIPLDAIKKFIKDENIKELKGNLKLNLKLNGDIKSIGAIKSSGFEEIEMTGKAEIKDLNLKHSSIPLHLNNINSILIFNNKTISIEQLSGFIDKSDIKFKGELNNIIPYIFGQNNIYVITGDLYSNKFNYNNIQLDKLKAKIKYSKNSISATNLIFNAFGGNITGNAHMTSNTNNRLFGDFNASKVDSKDFFDSMENFGQLSITSKNIKGKVTAKVTFSADLDKNYKLIKDKLVITRNYKIEQGELNDLPILKKLSHFVDETTLNSVKFENIESSFSINNSCINFQEVDIKSNAINLSVFGKQYFDNKIDYYVKIRLSELSSKKKKAKLEKQRKEFGDFEEDEKSRVVLYIKIGGTIDKPTFTYDFKRNRQRAKEILKTDKENIKKSIDKDFKLGIEEMKQDKEQWKRQEKGEYIIDWEENKKKDTISKNNKKDTKFTIEWE